MSGEGKEQNTGNGEEGWSVREEAMEAREGRDRVKLEDQRCLLLGATGDLGSALCLRMLERGYRHFLLQGHSNQAKLDDLSRTLRRAGCDVSTFCCDFTDPQASTEIMRQAIEDYGPIDLLLCLQGTSLTELIQDLSLDAWTELEAVNLGANIRACQLVLPNMIRREQGVILLCSSIWGLRGASMEVAYASLKSGIVGLTHSLARELGPSGIRVNALAPGWIDGQMNAGFSREDREAFIEEIPLGRVGTPEDVADAALFLIGDEARYITGQVLSVDGGYAI